MQTATILDTKGCCEMKSGYLVTINMQHIYESMSNPDLRSAIFEHRQAMHCVDGKGAQILINRFFGKKFPITPGNVVLKRLLEKPERNKILVIGSQKNTIDRIRIKYPLNVFTHDFSKFDIHDAESAQLHAEKLAERHFGTFSLIAIALGVPKQELLALALSKEFSRTPIVCIGGSFEMIAGDFPRSPKVLQAIGLEGIWRLAIQPQKGRVKRCLLTYSYFVRLLLFPSRLNSLLANPKK